MARSSIIAFIFIIAAATVITISTMLNGDPGDSETSQAIDAKIIETTDLADESLNPPSGFVHQNTDLTTGPTQSWPENIENQVWEYFAHQPGLSLTNIVSVECSETKCEIVFTGTEVNPKYVDEYSDLVSGMYHQPWNVQQSSIGRRDISPGARAFIITISNQEFDQSRKQSIEKTKEASLGKQ